MKKKKNYNTMCGKKTSPVLGGTELMAHREHIHVFKDVLLLTKGSSLERLDT